MGALFLHDLVRARRRAAGAPSSAPVAVVPAAPIFGVVALVGVVVGIIAVAFRGSWGAFRDAALAAHFERSAAELYPFAVDGLLIATIIALVLLRHDRVARWYCLTIIAGYTVASWLINFLHGLGMFEPDPVSGERSVPPWPVVAVIATLVIGTIFLGSHLLVYVARHLYPSDAEDSGETTAERSATDTERAATDEDEPLPLPKTNLELAKIAYRESLGPEKVRLSQTKMAERFGVTRRQAEAIQHEVRDELTGELVASAGGDADDEAPRHSHNGHASALERGAHA